MLEAVYHGQGRLYFEQGEAEYQYYIKDHLGNTRVLFADKDQNGEIDTSGNEIIQENHYYPFGLSHSGPQKTSTGRETNYKYNGKELHTDLGLEWYGFGARFYDPAIGRFTGVDPIADQFAWVTPYNYAENEPIANIDLWGLQKVSVNDIRNSQGQITRRNVTVSVNMKVLNLSSKGNFQFNNSLSRAGERASRSFSTSFNARVLDSPQTGLTSNEVPVNVKFTLSTQQVSSLGQVGNTDFTAMIVDQITDGKETAGRANLNDNISIIEASYIDGSSSEVLLHELGHNLGLDFGGKDGHTKDGSGLMGAKVNSQYSIDGDALKSMYQLLPVTGKSFNKQHKNTTGRAKEFFDDNAKKYDKDKAKRTGFN